jgi:hypothetical protein
MAMGKRPRDDFVETQCRSFYAETMGRPGLAPGITKMKDGRMHLAHKAEHAVAAYAGRICAAPPISSSGC